jgi:hypothetical protein
LQKNQKQQTAEDCLPEARRKISEPPYPSLPIALVSLVCEKGFSITQDEAVKFIKEADERKPPVPIAYQTTQNNCDINFVVRQIMLQISNSLQRERHFCFDANPYPTGRRGLRRNRNVCGAASFDLSHWQLESTNTNKLAVIVGLAKAGKTESQIAAAVKNEYGPLSSHTTYIVGREWRRVNKVGRHFGTTAKQLVAT